MKSKGIGSSMKKKYKVTTLLIFVACFFTAMISADIILKNNQGIKVVEKKVVAAGNYEEDVAEELDDVLTTASVEDTIDNETKTEALENVVDGTDNIEKEDALSEEDALEALQEELIEEELAETGVLAIRTVAPITYDKVIPKVNEFLNIRTEGSAKAKVVGKLYKESYATILERGEEWTKISSGDVTGYVNNEYLYFDQDALDMANKLDAFKVKITAGTVNIRSGAGIDSEVLAEAKKGDAFIHLKESDTEGWTAIQLNKDSIAYVASEFTEEYIDLDTAVSKAEEDRIQKEKELAKALEEAKKYKPKKTNRKAMEVSDKELFLLATVVAMEAVGESYEGQLAVANVVINRVLSGKWGDSITDVVYAPGQFSGANSGRIEKFESKVTESCKRAAVEALAGNNNIGDYMFFRMKNKADFSSYSKYYILGCHCFYQR